MLAGDKLIVHLRQPGFTYSAFRPFTTNKERIQKFKKWEIQDIYKNELDEAYFHDMLMEILKVYLEEQLQIKHSVIKH